jgi:hypothetical protein
MSSMTVFAGLASDPPFYVYMCLEQKKNVIKETI